jgi:hypothetical protein
MALLSHRRVEPPADAVVALDGHAAVEDRLLRGSLADLADDFDEVAALARDARRRLVDAQEEIHRARRAFEPDTRRAVREEIGRRRAEMGSLERSAESLRAAALDATPTARVVDALAAERRRLGDLARIHRTLAAAAITATDWQSPSFAHSVRPAAGRFAGRVTEHHDDYRRDRHADAAAFEAAYLAEYVDAPAHQALRALMTSCGMSGFATILHHVRGLKLVGPVLVGRGPTTSAATWFARTHPATRA